ncbi:hypothetical protein [Rhizobium sp. BK060]|uniref:hypothetical protein n=1 Tax=Rhizobium sp. BK060 TaxID=2587096 RepID=UPI00181AAFA7|nr:hypothetical protein [Rhizobium sp. BK060]MBB3397289.1 hypothetical protein [Rhizobium sp. BK060]
MLTARKLLQEKAIAIANDIRGLLRKFGLKVGLVGKVKFEKRINELVEDRRLIYTKSCSHCWLHAKPRKSCL